MSRTIATRFPPGTLIGGRYEVEGLLGWGGMAEVFSAVDRRLGRRVAVKVLRHQLAEDPRFVARLRREARAAGSLRDPRIVAVHDTGVQDGCPYLVMELVPGRNLAEVLRDEGPLSPERAAAIGGAVAAALAVAHAAGIVHRDVKPANIMVTPEGDVKVLDFGIARAMRWTPLADTPAGHGTPEYLSPEQARGEAADGRSDVYGLGVVLYETLTGRPPFTGESPVAVAYRHIEEAPVPLQALRPDVPPALAGIVLRCLAKRPAERYGRAGALASDLAGLSEGRPPSTPVLPVGPPATPVLLQAAEPPAERPRRRLRGAVAVALVLVAALVGNVAAGVMLASRARVTPAEPPPLLPPSRVVATGECAGLFDARTVVSWRPSRTARADGYEIYRSEDGTEAYTRIAVVHGGRTARFVDEDVASGARYSYLVRTTAGAEAGAASGRTEARTPGVCLW